MFVDVSVASSASECHSDVEHLDGTSRTTRICGSRNLDRFTEAGKPDFES